MLPVNTGNVYYGIIFEKLQFEILQWRIKSENCNSSQTISFEECSSFASMNT